MRGHCWALQSIQVSESEAKAVLGAGGFGQVLLVKYRGQFNALKCISKAFVKEQGLTEHVKREKVRGVGWGGAEQAAPPPRAAPRAADQQQPQQAAVDTEAYACLAALHCTVCGARRAARPSMIVACR